MNFLDSIILGIVQGISEWLPISSKTQVLLVSSYILNLPIFIAYSFGLFMEAGSIMSAIIYFWKDIIKVLKGDWLLLKYLIIVTIFTGIVGVPLYIISDKILQNAYNVAIPTIILGLILLGDSFYIKFSRMNKSYGLKNLSTKHLIIIGVAQGIAAFPGVSRSGITVSTMLLMGVKPEDAFRLSYLAYIPASIGAVVTTLLFTKHEIAYSINLIGLHTVMLAMVISTIVGLLTIGALLRFAKKNSVYLVTLTVGLIALVLGILDLIA